MAAEVDRDRLQALVRAGAHLVEVLPKSEYDAGHLPGAVNIPLATFAHGGVDALPRDRPVIVYCADNPRGLPLRTGEGGLACERASARGWTRRAHGGGPGNSRDADLPSRRSRRPSAEPGWRTNPLVRGCERGSRGPRTLAGTHTRQPARGRRAGRDAARPLTIRPNTTATDARKYAKSRPREPLVVTTSDGRLVGVLEPRRLRRPRASRPEAQPADA
jgi:hypothetical protein